MHVTSYAKVKYPLTEYLKDTIELKEVGPYLRGRCFQCFTNNLSVSSHKETYYCFKCLEGGDVITYVCKEKKLSQIEAAEFLITQAKEKDAATLEAPEAPYVRKSEVLQILDLNQRLEDKDLEIKDLEDRIADAKKATSQIIDALGGLR